MIVQPRPTSQWSAMVALVLLFAGTALSLAAMPAADGASRWEPDIRSFEASDRERMPQPGGIVFIGNSSIRGWDVAKPFPGLPVINRGFGGSQIADSVEFAARIVIPYKPKTVVFYAGDNDINAGKTPQQVLSVYREFVAKVLGALPDALRKDFADLLGGGLQAVPLHVTPSFSRQYRTLRSKSTRCCCFAASA